MSLISRLVNALLNLPPAETHDISITRDLQIPMPDGIILLADHYAPRTGPKRPTILIRSSYGRGGVYGLFYCLVYASQGYQVLMQSVRGTAGSGGSFVFARHERSDGLATVSWIKQQPWFSGEMATIGASYLGFTQWALAAEAGPELKAIVPQITSSDFHHFRFPGGSLLLEALLGWSTSMTLYAKTGLGFKALLNQHKQQKRLTQAYLHLPLGTADTFTINQPSATFQDVLMHKLDDAYWEPIDHSKRINQITAPAYLMAGWYDMFLNSQLRDYRILRAAGKQPYLLIGPWTHLSALSNSLLTTETLAWLRAHLKSDHSVLRQQPVRLFVMGANEWRDFPDWPLPVQHESWYLQENAALSPSLPIVSAPDHYRYDPADPTPAVGGNSLGSDKYMGQKDNRELEARADVLTYTSAPLPHAVELIGSVKADLYVHSSLQYTDFFTRLCVVDATGKSTNLADGILRLTPGSVTPEADGSLHISLELSPTAYHFKPGERFRFQISSGAHPHYIRNLGHEESPITATKLCIADPTIYHDPTHPSAFTLPIY